MKNLLGDIGGLEREEFKQQYDICEKNFIQHYLIPLTDERKRVLSFSRIVDHLNVNIQMIISEISFYDSLIFDSFEDDQFKENPARQLCDDYEAIINIFDMSLSQNSNSLP